MTKRNPVARALRSPHLAPKVKPNGKTYKREHVQIPGYGMTEEVAQKMWEEYCATHELPADIPRYPNLVYARDWKGWRDWLGLFDA